MAFEKRKRKFHRSSPYFLVRDDGLKLRPGRVAMAMTPERSASSPSWSAKSQFELPEASSSAEDFDSHCAVFPGEAASFCCYFIIHLCLHAGPRNRINSQPAVLLHTPNCRFFTRLFRYFKIMSIWHVKVCAYSQKTRLHYNRYILLDQNKTSQTSSFLQLKPFTDTITHFIEIKLQHKQAPNKAKYMYHI